MSAARAYLFNQLLANRIKAQHWNNPLGGELLMLSGSQSLFLQTDEQGLADRLSVADIHLTGPMYGKASNLCCADAAANLEQTVLSAYPDLLAGLEREGLKAERRALRAIPEDLRWQLDKQHIELAFTLLSGCFATAVVRELVNYKVCRQ